MVLRFHIFDSNMISVKDLSPFYCVSTFRILVFGYSFKNLFGEDNHAKLSK